ncbi:hypothetical protein B0H17DRAFT_1204439 [Mycena rosella]|uniref:Uncharacterized protein n=1 Tax=Mycena rosella TaxID=1033263 RepID=A0AAD7GFA2_MYCRO|nr:hypothetical protein B0H17DRAFT_1204439 [Mycena rosella]
MRSARRGHTGSTSQQAVRDGGGDAHAQPCMSLPPVPPRPYSAAPPQQPPYARQNYSYQTPASVESPPHFDDPLAAPRPHRVDPGLGANVSGLV